MKKNFLAFAVIVIALVGCIGGVCWTAWIGRKYPTAYVTTVFIVLLTVLAWPTIKAAWKTLNS